MMEKAVLKTLIYADIFDYPLRVYEIHKWLIGRKTTLRQVEKALERLRVKDKAEKVKDYYFLSGRRKLVRKRQQKEKQSGKFLWKAKMIVLLLKMIPFIKLVGISGGLAMENAGKGDDIDLFIVMSKNRLWISRLLTLGILTLIGQRRKVNQSGSKTAGKICANMLLEEDKLAQQKKDIYLAHEVLQMKVLWQRDGIYSKYLLDNEWVFKFLPNWVGEQQVISKTQNLRIRKSYLDYFDNLAKWLQLKIMQQPKGMERIEDGALYFHPKDSRIRVLSKYKQRVNKLTLS